jgi:hypothetical protein
MEFQLPSFDIVGKASDLIQGPPLDTGDADKNGIGPFLTTSKLEEHD